MEEGEPNVMWLSGLHIPESYLTALVQATCRKNGWPLDHSTLYTEVTQYRSEDEIKVKPGQGENTHKRSHAYPAHTIHSLSLSSLVFSFQVVLYQVYIWRVQTGTLKRAVWSGANPES